MNTQNMTAKIFRDISRRQFSWPDVCEILILLVATYFISIAAGRQNVQLEGVDHFAKEVKDKIRLLNLSNGVPN